MTYLWPVNTGLWSCHVSSLFLVVHFMGYAIMMMMVINHWWCILTVLLLYEIIWNSCFSMMNVCVNGCYQSVYFKLSVAEKRKLLELEDSYNVNIEAENSSSLDDAGFPTEQDVLLLSRGFFCFFFFNSWYFLNFNLWVARRRTQLTRHDS